MAISAHYQNGIPCYVISSESSYSLPTCESSEPLYVKNEGTGILTVSPRANETIDGGSSFQMAPDQSIFLNPIGTDWVAVLRPTDTLSINQIGYTAGAGGSVTQTGSITSAVTLNKPCGKITLVSHDFSNNDIQQFTLNNTSIEEDDIVLVTFRDGNAKLYCETVGTADGSCNITVGDAHNQATGSIVVVLNFVIIKGDS